MLHFFMLCCSIHELYWSACLPGQPFKYISAVENGKLMIEKVLNFKFMRIGFHILTFIFPLSRIEIKQIFGLTQVVNVHIFFSFKKILNGSK